MPRKVEDFDWAKAIYDLAIDKSATIGAIVEAAQLDPLAGDVSDMNLSELDLSNQDLSDWDLCNADMEGTILKGTRLLGARVDPHKLLEAKGWKEAELDEALRQKALELEALLDGRLPFSPMLLKKTDELELSVKGANAMKADNIVYVGDLIQKSEAELLRTPNFGRQALNEIKEVLASMGLHLQMEVPNWPPANIEELAKRFEDEY